MKNQFFIGDSAKYASGNGVVPVSSAAGMSKLNVADTARDFFAGLSTDDKIFLGNQLAADGFLKRGDAVENQSLFFNRALEFLTAKAYEVEYEVLPFRDVFPIINQGGAGVKEITSEVYDFFAKAQVISAAGKDIPFVAGGGKEIKYPVVMWGIGASWTIQELQAFVVAQRNNRARYSPEQIRQKAALRGVEEALNDQAFFGLPSAGIYGFMDNPLIPVGVVDQGVSGQTTWENKTADEILADVNGLADSIYVGSKMREKPNKLLLPPSKWSLIKNRRLDNRDISILTYLLENSQYFKSPEDIIPVNEYEAAGYNSTGKMTAYNKNEDKVCVEIPEETQTMPVQQQLFSYMLLWYAYSAGAVVRFPRSVAHSEGI
jgi:hypothetical protein